MGKRTRNSRGASKVKCLSRRMGADGVPMTIKTGFSKRFRKWVATHTNAVLIEEYSRSGRGWRKNQATPQNTHKTKGA